MTGTIHPSMRRQSPWLEFRGETETDRDGCDSDAMLRGFTASGAGVAAAGAGSVSTCSPEGRRIDRLGFG
jgi:hypothetical protein